MIVYYENKETFFLSSLFALLSLFEIVEGKEGEK